MTEESSREHLDQLRKDIDQLREERNLDIQSRVTALEAWKGKIDTEVSTLKESVDSINKCVQKTEKDINDRLTDLEKKAFKLMGIITFCAFILPIIASVIIRFWVV